MRRVLRILREPGVRLRIGVAIGSGLLLAVAFPNIDLGLVSLVALVPLLWTWRGASPARAALYGFCFGVAFFGALMYWLSYFGVLPILLVPAGCAAYSAVTGYFVAALDRAGYRSPWLTAAAWVFLEALRGRWPFGGLPWGDLGTALHDVAVGRALASWGGVALVSFLIVVVNAYILDAVTAVGAARRAPLIGAMVGLALVVTLVTLADLARFEPRTTGTLRVGLLQGNDQNRELSDAEKQAGYLTEKHMDLAARLRGHYDLIVFPESSLDRFNPQSDPGLRDRLSSVGRAHGSWVLANALVPAPDGRDFNTNLLYSPNGRLVGTYAKEHLVPFGEYVPLRSLVEWTGVVDRIPYDYSPGTKRTIFRVKGHRLASIICFESAFGPLARDFVHRGAEVVVVSTNNRSYRRSDNSAQHLALGQMRAAETGRPVVQASISGITAVIDADGHVHDQTRLFHNTVVSTTLTTTTGETPYVRFGDWVVAASAMLLIVFAALGRWRRRSLAFSRLADTVVEPADDSVREPVGV